MKIKICGLDTEYTVRGDGEIPVLLLHGWGSSFKLYDGIMTALSDRCCLYAVNFPGCGESEIMPKPWTLDDYCDFVMEFAAAMGLKDPLLIGHSHGGRVILKLTAQHLMNPSRIVLLDCAGLIPKKTFAQKARARHFKQIKAVLTLPILKNHTAKLLDRARAHYGSADYNAAPEVLRKTLVSLVNTDLRDILPNITASALLIWGDLDTATPLEDARLIESLIPDAGLCVLEGCGHFAFCEQPYRTAAILRSFIK